MIPKPRKMETHRENLSVSILDRLLDDEPGRSHESVREKLAGINDLKSAVIRDLENLLNTRRLILLPSTILREVNNSLWVYGLQDYTAQNPKSTSVRQHLRLEIEKTIRCFEPRLKNVAVKLEVSEQKERNLRFRITALLVVEPIEEPVLFDTFFDISRGEYKITG
jgi:type VI secretion system protein ImpF